MSSFETWGVPFNSRTPEDILRSVGPLPLPIVSHSGFYKSAKNTDKSFDGSSDEPLTVEELASIESDGRYYQNNLTNVISYRCTGKLIHDNGTSSGFVIGPNLIMTAGHCVHSGGPSGRYYTNMYFQPGYPTMGKWYRLKRIFAHSNWISQKDAYYSDVAICITEEVMTNDLWYGIKTQLEPEPKVWAIYGYPAKPPFNGDFPYGDSGRPSNKPWSHGELRFNLSSCDTIDLTAGCSGGPWIFGSAGVKGQIAVKCQPPQMESGKYISGLNSFVFDRYPGIMISPYFGRDIHNYIKKVIESL